MRSLLDVNVLIALLDPDHVRHEFARQWLRGNIAHGWATCAITQNGCLRIMSQRTYAHPMSPERVVKLLEEAIDTEHHEFWPGASLLTPGVIDWPQVAAPKQITDLYLLALAAQNNGRLVTFDERIAKDAVLIAGDETYQVIPTSRSYRVRGIPNR